MPLLPSAFDCPCAPAPAPPAPRSCSARLLRLCVPRVPPDLPSLCLQAAGSVLLDSAFFSMLPACSLSVNPAVKRPPPLELERGTTVGRGDQHRCGVFQFELRFCRQNLDSRCSPGRSACSRPRDRAGRCPCRIDHLDVGDAQATGIVTGGENCGVTNLGLIGPTTSVPKKTESVPSPALRTTSSVDPSRSGRP